MTFGDFHPNALDALNMIFALDAHPLSLKNLHHNNNADDKIVAEVSLNAAEIVEANESLNEGLEDLGEGENDPDFSDEEEFVRIFVFESHV